MYFSFRKVHSEFIRVHCRAQHCADSCVPNPWPPIQVMSLLSKAGSDGGTGSVLPMEDGGWDFQVGITACARGSLRNLGAEWL